MLTEHVSYFFSRSAISLAEGNVDNAVSLLNQAKQSHMAQEYQLTWAWRISVLQGHIYSTLGHLGDAIEIYERAFDELISDSMMMPFGLGRARFLGSRRTLIRDYMESLVKIHDFDKAFLVAIRGQGLLVRSIGSNVDMSGLEGDRKNEYLECVRDFEQATERFDRAVKQCAGVSDSAFEQCVFSARVERTIAFESLVEWLEEGSSSISIGAVDQQQLSNSLTDEQSLLVLYPSRGEWYAFLLSRGRLYFRVLKQPSNAFDEWPQIIGQSAHLYVSTGGFPGANTLHRTLDEHGTPWASKLTLSYLPSVDRILGSMSEQGEVVSVFGDPNLDLGLMSTGLPNLIEETLGPAVQLKMGDEVTRAALISELSRSDAVIFVGHGYRECEQLGNCLGLAEGAMFGAMDILEMGVGPRVVLIIACHSSESARLAISESIGLTEAFLAVGTETVLVAEGAVPEAEALEFLKRFLAAGGAQNPAKAYKTVVSQLVEEGSTLDWGRFRVVGLR
ncbi:MAG: CHAT domain-containing protein [Bradymonadia bacterium]